MRALVVRDLDGLHSKSRSLVLPITYCEGRRASVLCCAIRRFLQLCSSTAASVTAGSRFGLIEANIASVMKERPQSSVHLANHSQHENDEAGSSGLQAIASSWKKNLNCPKDEMYLFGNVRTEEGSHLDNISTAGCPSSNISARLIDEVLLRLFFIDEGFLNHSSFEQYIVVVDQSQTGRGFEWIVLENTFLHSMWVDRWV